MIPYLLLTCLISLLPLSLSKPTRKSPTVELPYATYQGYHNTTSDLDIYLGMRYAADTSGQNRWRKAQPPVDERKSGVRNATVFPPQCPQAAAGGITPAAIYSPTQSVDSEDCLFLNVYAPPEAKDLPVLVWIHGGGWDHNSAREFDPTPMINYSNNTFIGIIIQYRLGAFGFLQPSLSANPNTTVDRNVGITDAAVALEWVQDHIHLFGGDKQKVTIWGQSAGGGTILNLVSAQSERGRKELWRGVVVSSPYLTPMGSCESEFWTTQYKNFFRDAGCSDIECLRNAPSDLLRNLSHTYDTRIGTGHISAYEPCVEGKGGYIINNTATNLITGTNTKYIIAGNNYNDASSFVSTTALNPASNTTNISSQADTLLREWLLANFPLKEGSGELNEVFELYKLGDFVDNHNRAFEIEQDIIFGCPDNWLIEGSKGKGWRYLYAVGMPYMREVSHQYHLNLNENKKTDVN